MFITALIWFATGTLFGTAATCFIINKGMIAEAYREIHEEISQELKKELQEILRCYSDALKLKEGSEHD